MQSESKRTETGAIVRNSRRVAPRAWAACPAESHLSHLIPANPAQKLTGLSPLRNRARQHDGGMRHRFWSNRLRGGAVILLAFSQIWNLPGHIDSAQWWCERLTMFEADHAAWAICGVGLLLLFRPELVWLWRRVVGVKAFSGDAAPATYSFHVPPASGTTSPPSAFARVGRFLLRVIGLGSPHTVPVRGIAEIEQCHQELVKYIRSQLPDPIEFEHVALWKEFQPHIETVCHILDEQKIPHPEIDAGIILVGTGEWGTFLARLLAVKGDVEKARLVYGQMQRRRDHGGSAS